MTTNLVVEREQAIHLLRSGQTVKEVAESLSRHQNWVRKWWKRYQQKGWDGLQDQSRAPKKHGRKLSTGVRQAICQARSELEAEAARGEGLKYIGALAVRTRLKAKQIKPLPSQSSIERVLRARGLTRKRDTETAGSIKYPHLKPTKPHQLCQVDIVPHFLTGGERVACFNALDVVSRYPTGQAFCQRRSQDAVAFLIHVWQQIGLPHYTQVDNEGCFSGGTTHQYVLGRVVRLALNVGTEFVFSPCYHPESNGFVERFHQDYDRHVWEETYLRHREDVQVRSENFFNLYRHSQHHSALKGQSPDSCHHQQQPIRLPPDFTMPEGKLPLREGRIHFIRRIKPDGSVRVLNANWTVPEPDFSQGVWVTIQFQPSGAILSIYDAAPDVADRLCLVSYPFPLTEPVLPHPTQSEGILVPTTVCKTHQTASLAPTSSPPLLPLATCRQPLQTSSQLLITVLAHAARFAGHFVHTMY